MLWISGSKTTLFNAINWYRDDLSIVFTKLGWPKKWRRGWFSFTEEKNRVLLSLAWNIIFSDNLKVLVFKILEMKDMVFWGQNVDENMTFTDYWKVLVLAFRGMGKTVFSWAKKLREIWYLLITVNFLFWTFRWWEIPSFLKSRSWWKDDIYIVFLSFLWYSRAWEILFFAQWRLSYPHQNKNLICYQKTSKKGYQSLQPVAFYMHDALMLA